MEIVRDVLDKQVVDCDGVKIGRVDGIVVEWVGDEAPRVVAIELGAVAIAERIGPRVARAVKWLAVRIGGPERAAPHRIAWRDVAEIGLDVKLRVRVGDTSVHEWQRWLYEHIVSHIPGAHQ